LVKEIEKPETACNQFLELGLFYSVLQIRESKMSGFGRIMEVNSSESVAHCIKTYGMENIGMLKSILESNKEFDGQYDKLNVVSMQ
jgi:hypothetical protein